MHIIRYEWIKIFLRPLEGGEGGGDDAEGVYLPINYDFDERELERLAGVLRENCMW